MSVELNNWSNTLNIRCVVPCCECKSFKPGSIFLRQCECCRHSWVAHVLAKLNPLPLFPCNIEGLTGAIAYDIASMILFGTHAIPVKLKILLDRIIPSHIQNDINRILHIFGWSFQDYSRGYILIDNMGQAREHWNMCTSEEEPVILQQFLRFYETRALAYDMLLKEYSRNPPTGSSNELPLSSLTSSGHIIGQQASESGALMFPSVRNGLPNISSVVTPPSTVNSSGIDVIKSLTNNRLGAPPLPFPSNPAATFPLLPILPGGPGNAAVLANFLSNAGGNKAASMTAQMSSYLSNGNPLETLGLNDMKIADQMEKTSDIKCRTTENHLAKSKFPATPSRDEPLNKKQRFRFSGSSSDHKSLAYRKPVNRSVSMKSDSMNGKQNDDDESTRTGSPLSSTTEMETIDVKKEDFDDANKDKNANSLINGIGRTKKRVLCTTCNKTFCDKGALKIHYSAVHLQEMHKCTMKGCNMWFSSRRSRNRHSANPNPRLHMSQSNKKLPDNAIIVDDGTGRPLGDRLPIPASVLNPPTVPVAEDSSDLQNYHSRPQATSSPLLSPLSPSYSRICAPLFSVPAAKLSFSRDDLRSSSRSSSISEQNAEMDLCEPINLVLSKSSMQEVDDDTDDELPEDSDNNKFFNKENEKDGGSRYSLTVKTDDSSSPPMLLSRGEEDDDPDQTEENEFSQTSEGDDILRDVMRNSLPNHRLPSKIATPAQ